MSRGIRRCTCSAGPIRYYRSLMPPATITPPVEHPVCAGCGSHDATVRFERKSDLHAEEAFVATTDSFHGYGRVVTCDGCGLVRLSPRQSWEFLEGAYRESEDPLYMTEARGRTATAKAMLRLVERHTRPGRLLDAGCGPGMLLDAAKARGWNPSGVELCRWAARQARIKHGNEIIEGSLETANLPANTYDAVTMLDVIEHLADPRQAIRDTFRILKPGGVAFLLTPDIDAPVSKLMGRWWWGLRPAHLYYFSRVTLSNLMKDAGFEIAATHRVGRRFTFGYWISRLRGYAPPFVDLASGIARMTRLENLPIYVNTFDSVAVIGVKKP